MEDTAAKEDSAAAMGAKAVGMEAAVDMGAREVDTQAREAMEAL